MPVLEGYGHDRDDRRRHLGRLENHRFGTVGRALPGVELRIAEDGEILMRARTCSWATSQPEATAETLRRGRLAAHRRPRIDRRGRLSLDHRPQEGHHHHRRRQEHHAGEHRERPQAVPLDLAGGHVRRPQALPVALITLDEEEIRPGRGSTACPRISTARSRTTPRSARSSRTRSTASTPTTRRSSRSRSSRSSTTTSRRRPAS